MKKIVLTKDTPLNDAIFDSEEDIILIRDGHAIALVVPFDDDDVEWYARERDPAFIASIADARHQLRQGKSVSHEELKKRLGIQ